MDRHQPLILQRRARRAVRMVLIADLGAAVGVEGVVDRRREPQLLVVIGRRELEAPDEGVQPGRFRPARPAGRDIGIADDSPQLNEARVVFQVVTRQHHLERAVAVGVAVLAAAHIEGVAL